MELQRGIEFIDATSADIGLSSRLSLSSGTGHPNSKYEGYQYAESALIPVEPWRSPTSAEVALLSGSREPLQPGHWISLVSLPSYVLDSFAGLRARVAAAQTFEEANGALDNQEWQAALTTYVDYAQDFARSTNDVFPDKMGIRANAAGLPTVTFDYSTSTLVGLHLDSWFHEPIRRRHLSPNRIVANLSDEPRYLLYLNLPLLQLGEFVLSPDEWQDEAASYYVGSKFLQRYPDYPIVRVCLLPGEAYIAPTENIIHDGSTLGMTSWDIHLALLGRFSSEPV